MLKNQLQLLIKEFTTLKEKIKNKLHSQQQAITQTTQKFNESTHKLELQMKENSENEKVLAQLGQEFEELGKELE